MKSIRNSDFRECRRIFVEFSWNFRKCRGNFEEISCTFPEMFPYKFMDKSGTFPEIYRTTYGTFLEFFWIFFSGQFGTSRFFPETSRFFPEKHPEHFRKKIREISRKFPGNFRLFSTKFLGKFLGFPGNAKNERFGGRGGLDRRTNCKSRKSRKNPGNPGNVREMSGTLSGNFLEMS